MARVEDEGAALIAMESRHPAADVVRETLASAVDLAGTSQHVDVADIVLLAPVQNPSKVLAIGLNYADHARETGRSGTARTAHLRQGIELDRGSDQPIRFSEADLVQQVERA